MFSHLLVPLDGSEYGARALAYAEGLAKSSGGKISLLMVLLRPALESAPRVPKLDEQSRKFAEEHLEQTAATVRKHGLAEVSVAVELGEPAERITEYARSQGVDLIVMSTHGLGATGRYAIGSVALKVLMTAPCPVFMVRIEQPK